MLIKCPECELQVSDRAISCPHCGYIIRTDKTPKVKSKRSSRQRLPNGFGQISKITNCRLSKPYRAMITVGKDSKGKSIVKLLKPQAYFKTYNEAYEALLEYNKNPYDLDDDITVLDLYNRWAPEYFKTLKSKSSERTITSAWKYCSSVYDMRAKDLRARHIKGCMEEGRALMKGEEHTPSAGVKSRIKSVFNLMLDYALEYEIVDKNYARTFDVSDDILEEKEKARRGHLPFSDAEMELLWQNINNIKYIDVVLIQCYSGWRPQELGLILLEDVDLENWTFKGGMKTDAGRDRIVPIHSRIRELVKEKYNEAVSLGSKYLINSYDGKTHRDSKMFTYDKYQQRFKAIKERLGLNPEHRPHDGRMHFITMAKKYNVDEYAIKYMVGHTINDLTERVYTKREISWLKDEIEKIK